MQLGSNPEEHDRLAPNARARRKKLEDFSYEAALEHVYVEVDDEADPPPAQLQVSQQLRSVDRQQVVNTFQLQYYGIFDQDIEPIAAVEANTLVDDGHSDLRLEAKAAQE